MGTSLDTSDFLEGVARETTESSHLSDGELY